MKDFEIVEIKSEKLEEVTAIHMEAFREHLNVLLGEEYNKVFLKWFSEKAQCISFMSISSSRISGYVVGASWGYQEEINKYLLPHAIKAIAIKPWVVLNGRIINTIWLRLKTMFGANKHISLTQKKYQGKIISLVGIGVTDQARGKGVSKALINKFEVTAKELGYNVMRLSVYKNNTVARHFYEKAGWQPEGGEGKVIGYYKFIT